MGLAGQETIILKQGVREIGYWYRRDRLTMVSDWTIADLNNEDAEGVASKPRIKDAPALCPAMVIWEASPPKLGTTFCKNFKAFIASVTPRLVGPLGGKKPSCARNVIRIWISPVQAQSLTTPRRY